MNQQQDRQPTKRLFFALWPGQHARDAMFKTAKALTKQTAGRLVSFENLHLTLAFVGSVTEQQQQCMEQAASQVTVQRFTLELSQLGFWPKPRVAWIGATEMPDALLQLASSLNANLSACGYEPDKRPFQAHITLLRKAQRHPKDTQTGEIHWPVDCFVLVESITHAEGVEYRVIKEWPLN
ncbi:MAG: RNA 2',3'-cyclic phosphodiesterase [Gammaproteobacteria bacterium]